MLNTALAYLSYGWSIFPLCPMSKVPAFKWDKYQTEKPTQALVTQWWTNTPGFNIGLVTGAISCIVVVDCDTPDAVDRYLSHSNYKPTLAVATGQGMHFYHHAPNFRVSNAVRLLPDLDIRGDGGYVVAPPSIHPNGKRYQWHKRALIQPLPGYIFDLVKPREYMRTPQAETKTFPAQSAVRGTAYAQSVFDREYSSVISAVEHGRNNQLNRSAYNLGQLCGDGLLNRYDVENALAQAAMACGLPEQEALRTIASGLNAGIGNPRSLRGKR